MKKKDKIKKLEDELKWYRKNYKKVCSTVYEISEALVPGCYVPDGCNATQACEILSKKIIKDFAPKKKIKWGCWFPKCMK